MNKLLWHFIALRNTIELIFSAPGKAKLAIPDSAKPAICFHFTKPNYRFYLPIIRAFHSAGYHCFLHADHKFIGNGKLFFNWISDLDRVYFLVFQSGLEHCELLIRDSVVPPTQADVKTLYLSDKIYDKNLRPLKENVLPFSIHPDQYQLFDSINKDDLRFSERKFRVFFSGNASEQGYKDEIINRLHNKLSRNQILRTIKSELGAEVITVFEPDAQPDFQNKILLLTSDFWVNDTQKQHTIKKSEWFNYLALSDFFLACPGFSHPLCHNLIESMAVGTIPILEHPEYLQPNLTDGVNCIAFSGKAELIVKLKQVLELSSSEIREMREQVVSYYEKFMAPAYLVKQLTAAKSGTTFYYYSSAQSVNFFKEHFKPTQPERAAE